MRYGINSLQLSFLIPQGIAANNLLNYLSSYNHVDLIRAIAQGNFKHIELSGDLQLLLPSYYTPEAIRDLERLKEELGISYSVHLPLWSVEPSTPLSSVKNGSVQAIVDHINLVKHLKPEFYVLHATGALAAEFSRMNLPPAAKNYLLALFQNNAQESIRVVLDQTGIPSRQLAIETIEFPIELTLEIANSLDVSICFDTGHILAGFSGPVDFFECLELCFPRLAEIHLHDCPLYRSKGNIGYGKDHKTLGKGDLNLEKFLDFLESRAFSGPIIFELSVNDATDSIAVIRNLRPGLV